MWNLINAPETEIFGIAIALMALLGVFEVISMLAGGISDWLDNLLRGRIGCGGRRHIRAFPELAVCRTYPGIDVDGGVPCRIRIDGLSVSDGLCHCIRQLSEWHAGSSHRLVSFPALSAGNS